MTFGYREIASQSCLEVAAHHGARQHTRSNSIRVLDTRASNKPTRRTLDVEAALFWPCENGVRPNSPLQTTRVESETC